MGWREKNTLVKHILIIYLKIYFSLISLKYLSILYIIMHHKVYLRSLLPTSYTREKRSRAGIWLYATHDIRKWQKVIEYIWPKVATKIADTVWGKYLFTVNSRYTILWNIRENKARRINHSCLPNCEPREIRGHIFIYAIKNIKTWEELTYNYGSDYFQRIIKPLGCRCKKCTKKNSISFF